jgi:hypothetical protein
MSEWPDIPDYLEPLIAWRVWQVDRGRLCSYEDINSKWHSGLNQAHCDHHQDGIGLRCGCGLFLWQGIESALGQMQCRRCDESSLIKRLMRVPHRSLLLGACLIWGKVARYSDYYLAEYAQPILVCTSPNHFHQQQAKDISQRYQLELADFADAERKAKEMNDFNRGAAALLGAC